MKSKLLLRVISISFITLLFVGGLYLIKEGGLEKNSDKIAPPASLWDLAIGKVHSTWATGAPLDDQHLLMNCPDLKVDVLSSQLTELSQCKAKVFRCFYQDRQEKLRYKKKWYPLSINFLGKDGGILSSSKEALNESSEYGFPISISVGSEKKNFILRDHCHDAILQDGFYWGSNERDQSKRVWHTSGIHYVVDKFLVRNIEIEEWLKNTKTSLPIRYDSKPFAPATTLIPDQMRSYCAYKGKELLHSNVLAAMTFHHGRVDVENISSEPPSSTTAPYPFSHRKDESPHFLVTKKKGKFKKEFCRKIFSKECLANFSQLPLFSLGWTGAAEILGGPLEYVENREYPRKNLKASSYYFPLNSRWHQAGELAYWSGRDHGLSSFNFFTESPTGSELKTPGFKFDVGFRCMKKVFRGRDD